MKGCIQSSSGSCVPRGLASGRSPCLTSSIFDHGLFFPHSLSFLPWLSPTTPQLLSILIYSADTEGKLFLLLSLSSLQLFWLKSNTKYLSLKLFTHQVVLGSGDLITTTSFATLVWLTVFFQISKEALVFYLGNLWAQPSLGLMPDRANRTYNLRSRRKMLVC